MCHREGYEQAVLLENTTTVSSALSWEIHNENNCVPGPGVLTTLGELHFRRIRLNAGTVGRGYGREQRSVRGEEVRKKGKVIGNYMNEAMWFCTGGGMCLPLCVVLRAWCFSYWYPFCAQVDSKRVIERLTTRERPVTA